MRKSAWTGELACRITQLSMTNVLIKIIIIKRVSRKCFSLEHTSRTAITSHQRLGTQAPGHRGYGGCSVWAEPGSPALSHSSAVGNTRGSIPRTSSSFTMWPSRNIKESEADDGLLYPDLLFCYFWFGSLCCSSRKWSARDPCAPTNTSPSPCPHPHPRPCPLLQDEILPFCYQGQLL